MMCLVGLNINIYYLYDMTLVLPSLYGRVTAMILAL